MNTLFLQSPREVLRDFHSLSENYHDMEESLRRRYRRRQAMSGWTGRFSEFWNLLGAWERRLQHLPHGLAQAPVKPHASRRQNRR